MWGMAGDEGGAGEMKRQRGGSEAGGGERIKSRHFCFASNVPLGSSIERRGRQNEGEDKKEWAEKRAERRVTAFFCSPCFVFNALLASLSSTLFAILSSHLPS